MSNTTTETTTLTIDLTIEAWASGAPGPCPICSVDALEGADCPSQHYNEAAHMAEAFTMSITKAVNLITERVSRQCDVCRGELLGSEINFGTCGQCGGRAIHPNNT